MAAKIDTLVMRGLVGAFDKVLFPMGVHGLRTVGERLARLRGHPLGEYRFENGGRFLYPNYDGYWGYYLRGGHSYEPELGRLFGRLIGRETRFAFIDGGANFGYWSCFLAQWPDRVSPVVAVEPAPETFAILKRNGASNGLICVEAAISDTDGGSLSLWVGAHHDASSVIPKSGPGSTTDVPTVSVDGLVERYCDDAPLVLVKLDVEGCEPQAFAGAKRTLDAGNAIIFECHGWDQESLHTRAALSYGLQVHFLPPSGGPIPITDIDTLKRLKTNRGMGYNLIAFRQGSPFDSTIRE